MNIALAVHDFDPGFGQGRYAVELARRLARRHEVWIYANRFGVKPEPNWTYQKVPACRSTALSTVFTYLASVEKLLHSHRHDIIHAQGLTCWSADVITAHICNASRRREAPGTHFRSRLFPLLIVPWERQFYRRNQTSRVIAISRRVQREIAEHYQRTEPIDVIHHGTDTEHFRPARDPAERAQCRVHFSIATNEWAWLFIGEGAKGLRQTIEALPKFPDATLLVITRSPLAEYQAAASRLGVNDRIRWRGPENDPSLAYRAADVFVYPSEYDAFGLVVAEAMASELPVIVGSEIGAAEWIVPGQNGLLCDPHRIESLVESLRQLKADAALARKMGREARLTVCGHSWDQCAQSTEALYERVLRERP